MSSASNNTIDASIDTGLDDVKYLLYLEALKRCRDDEAKIRRRVETKWRLYQKTREECVHLYDKYTSLVKNASLYCALDDDHAVDDTAFAKAKDNVAQIKQKLEKQDMTGSFDEAELQQFKANIAKLEEHPYWHVRRQQVNEQKKHVKDIQTVSSNIENLLETAIADELNKCVQVVAPPSAYGDLENSFDDLNV